MVIINSKKLRKKARRETGKFPCATIAYYGPNDKFASKVVLGFLPTEKSEAEILGRWISKGQDVREDLEISSEILRIVEERGIKSIVTVDDIIGCPHEETIDYPSGSSCPRCPFWAFRDRWTGEITH